MHTDKNISLVRCILGKKENASAQNKRNRILLVKKNSYGNCHKRRKNKTNDGSAKRLRVRNFFFLCVTLTAKCVC